MKTTTLFCLVLALGAVACGSNEPSSQGDGTFPDEALMTVKSDDGAYTVEVRTSPQPPSRGTNEVEYRVLDANGAGVDDLSLTVTPWMPEMGHGSSVVPDVAPEDEGKYLVTNVVLFMPGTWQLRTTIDGRASDHVAPEFSIP